MSARQSPAVIWLSVSLVLIVLVAAWPLISALVASGIADALGCTVNEGGASPCPFRGADIGEGLAVMFVIGWLAFVTLPLGAVALAIWLVVACVVIVMARRRRREA